MKIDQLIAYPLYTYKQYVTDKDMIAATERVNVMRIEDESSGKVLYVAAVSLDYDTVPEFKIIQEADFKRDFSLEYIPCAPELDTLADVKFVTEG